MQLLRIDGSVASSYRTPVRSCCYGQVECAYVVIEEKNVLVLKSRGSGILNKKL